MSKLIRTSQKIFAGGITPTGNVAVFGSLAASAPAYSNDPDTIQSLAAWASGWGAATIGNQSPAFQDFNGYQYVVTRMLAYLLQAGIPEWHASTIYYTGSFCQVAGVIYRSLTDANTNNLVTDATNWASVLPDAKSAAKAWVTFDVSGTILSAYNVSSVAHTGTGLYTLNFTNALPNANYCATVGGTWDGRPMIGGVQTTFGPNTITLKTTTQLGVIYEASTSAFSDVVQGYVAIYGG